MAYPSADARASNVVESRPPLNRRTAGRSGTGEGTEVRGKVAGARKRRNAGGVVRSAADADILSLPSPNPSVPEDSNPFMTRLVVRAALLSTCFVVAIVCGGRKATPAA